ncbi:PEP-CTERM/exosortase system-associated acyltransferase [Undibacterium pigrum]|uniref:N-acyl amino acid synthase of PEP-CTERM/exosortase system n=1 Tax=Undibacterium pigrum TaxID=401470 RepID=A0A318IN66_9BURK|nr:PEP-CTERM/exosortase system-associated acyltransferase [Undibacterium pigrum]PXX35320.1 N-acyl amino acid synthase of PEP-CTERM/exosortase system [Undibacterium pigrum]
MEEEFQRSQFRFGRINCPTLLAESYRLRYQVYCKERGFLQAAAYPCGMETDFYDDDALHFAALGEDGHMAGTVRLVGARNRHYPLQEKCALDIAIPPHTAEVSRLAVTRGHDRFAISAGDEFLSQGSLHDQSSRLQSADERRWQSELAIGLYKVIYREAKLQGIQYFLAAMEGSLARMLIRFQLPFKPVGPVVDYYGKVQPFLLCLSECEQNFARLVPGMFEDFTHGVLEVPPKLYAASTHTSIPASLNSSLNTSPNTSATIYEIN